VDIGCGTGTDILLLAKWGFHRVVGLDVDGGAIGIARRRATRMRLASRATFIAGAAEDLEDHLAPSSVDVVLHTLVGNNLEDRYHAHFRSIARALKPRGLLVSCIRAWGYEENMGPGRVPPVAGMRRYFELSPGVSTHLAESGRAWPPHAPVVFWLGRPRKQRAAEESRRGRARGASRAPAPRGVARRRRAAPPAAGRPARSPPRTRRPARARSRRPG